ncbi:ABC transporter ATP-binding protein YxdL [Peptococcaceae bacterium CEB3]|nr:ABC transporter ATP-binding protein YxdL [Peptococcaceae bacterium CEB3]
MTILNMTVLKTEGLSKTYGSKSGFLYQALEDIHLRIEKGEFVAVMGPSGSGKTTLLNILATLDRPTLGRVEINGTDPSLLKEGEMAMFRRREIGFIFQDFNLLDTLSLRENILLPLALDKTGVEECAARLREWAGILNIREILDKRTYEVSGGEKQRAAIARGLIHAPSLLFADEPTGNLDSKASREVMESLARINSERETTILMVTHDPFAASYCKRILFIKDGKLAGEVRRGANRQAFFQQILDSVSVLGGNRE